MTALGRWSGDFGHQHAAGLLLTGTTLTFDTGTKRTGGRSYKFDSSASANLDFTFSGVSGRDYFAVGHFRLPAATGLPSADCDILGFLTTGTQIAGQAYLTSTGKIRLVNNSGVQVGSDSAATITTDTWYRLEMKCQTNTGANDDQLEVRLDGVVVATTTTAPSAVTTAPGHFYFGWGQNDPGTSEVIFWDDLGLNDNQGSVNNTWLGDTKVYTSFAVSDNARTNWVDGAGGTTGLFGSVDNVPPTGVATASSGATNQVENAVSAAGASYDANMQDYTTLGIGAGDTIQCIIPVVEIGSSSTTGTDTITHSVVSNPAIAGTAGSCDIVAGTYPASWNRSQGVITENPTVVKGTQPVMRITKDIATTRINSCSLMALVVAVSPGVAPTTQRYRSIMMVGD